MEPLKDVLHSHREARGFTIEKVETLTGIPSRFIGYVESAEYHKLPPDAYVFGYLTKLASLYALERDVLWDMYKNEKGVLFRSGETDRFPGSQERNNRRRATRNPLLSIPAIAAVLLFGYLLLQANSLFKSPEIYLATPAIDLTTSDGQHVFSGIVAPKDTLTINNEPVRVSADGEFEKAYSLQDGMNIFTFRVKKLLGKASVTTRRVLYEPPPPEFFGESAAQGRVDLRQ